MNKEMSEREAFEAWECHWGICDHDQAQKCRANKEFNRRTQTWKGCGGKFPRGTTQEKAKDAILNQGSKE